MTLNIRLYEVFSSCRVGLGRAHRTAVCLVVALALLGRFAPVYAQSADATLRGAAPANSTVTAKNTATGLTRTAQVGANGRYVLVGLPPGTYRVDAGTGEQVVELAIASTLELDLTAAAQPQAAVEEVVISGKRLVEVRTSAVGNGISQRQIETTPQITRNFLEFADTVPGMSFDVDSKGNTTVRSGPQGPGATNVYIDGVGQKNYVRSSGITGQGGADNPQIPIGDPGNPFPQLAIGEYKVITSNYGAEYDQISGAAITAVTRSGTNKFEGEVFYSHTSSGLRAATPAELAANSGKQGGPSREFGFAVGGPIIMDRMHYFLTYEGKDFTSPNTVFAPQYVDSNGTPLPYLSWMPANLLANYGPVSNPFKEQLVFGKLDWEATANDRFELSTKYRRERQQAGAQGIVAASAASTYKNDEIRLQFNWDHTFGFGFNELKLTYEDTKDQPSNASGLPGNQYAVAGVAGNNFALALQTDGVDPRSYFGAFQKGPGFQDDLTFNPANWHGEHAIKVGFKFKAVNVTSRDATTAPLYAYYLTSAGVDADPFQVVFGAQGDSSLPTESKSSNRQYGIYLQDDWSVDAHWKFNLGMRYDYEQTPTFTDYHTPDRYVTALTALDPNTDPAFYTLSDGTYIGAPAGQHYNESLAKGGINIFDYISNGHNRRNPGNEIQPRLGLSYDLFGDQRHVVFAGAGRSYDRNVFSILQHESNKATLTVPTVQFFNPNNPGCASAADASNTCVAWQDSYATAAGLNSLVQSSFGEMHLINNHLKAPHSDQFSIGMRNKLGDWNSSVTLTHIISKDGVIARNGNRFGDGSWWWWQDGWYAGSGGSYGGFPTTPDGNGVLWLFDNAKDTTNDQLLLSFEMPYSRESHWGASISYTYSNARGRLIDNGDYQTEWAFNSGSNGAPVLISNNVAKHRLVAVGNVDGPWGLIFGGKMVIETPRPFTGYTYDNPPPQNGYVEQYRYLNQRVDNKIGYETFDFQVTKNFKIAGASSAEIRVDLLNALNRHNYSQYIYDNAPQPPVYNTNGNINGVPRTLKLGVNVKF
jgi:outer membrane receptor protein involved in Fe transport